MSSEKTPVLNLHRWQPGDDFLRAEFNDNFTALDTAINTTRADLASARTDAANAVAGARSDAAAALDAKLVFGTYLGNNGEQTINLGFTPRAVLIQDRRTVGDQNYAGYGALIYQGSNACIENGTYIMAAIVTGGFTVTQYSSSRLGINWNDRYYNYMAMR